MAKSNLTPEFVRELLHYDSETGLFTWRVCRKGNIKIGDVAGYRAADGRLTITINSTRYLAYRLAWLYVHGRWPDKNIDHIDGNPSNDKFDNLREANASQNAQNLSSTKRNKHGFVGVSWDGHRNKWCAQIVVNRKNIRLGRFCTPELAHAAYCAAKAKLHTFNPFLRD